MSLNDLIISRNRRLKQARVAYIILIILMVAFLLLSCSNPPTAPTSCLIDSTVTHGYSIAVRVTPCPNSRN